MLQKYYKENMLFFYSLIIFLIINMMNFYHIINIMIIYLEISIAMGILTSFLTETMFLGGIQDAKSLGGLISVVSSFLFWPLILIFALFAYIVFGYLAGTGLPSTWRDRKNKKLRIKEEIFKREEYVAKTDFSIWENLRQELNRDKEWPSLKIKKHNIYFSEFSLNFYNTETHETTSLFFFDRCNSETYNDIMERAESILLIYVGKTSIENKIKELKRAKSL